ncbi:hypothetical protein [Arthrobacter sp. HY1533]|uniref:hypothetical protein n=1 Tax=Arthrobacter sp. HY1533 TaxID=2970919 RepID=UPI0022BA0A9B|nr:hypothetical protein [Arthrobacter sp. HY1533]
MTEQPAEQPPAPAPDPLALLDFPLVCDMIHHDHTDCQQPATHFARVHFCRETAPGKHVYRPAGIRVVVCDKFINDAIELANSGEGQCARCSKKFTSIVDRIWDIEKFKDTK